MPPHANPRATGTRRRAVPGVRTGLTLLELVVVLALLGLGAALVLPSLDRPARAVTRDDVVRAARATAIARAQALTLRLATDGAWQLASPRDGGVLTQGKLSEAGDALALDLSPVGGCTLRPPVPASLARWDAARCGLPAPVAP